MRRKKKGGREGGREIQNFLALGVNEPSNVGRSGDQKKGRGKGV